MSVYIDMRLNNPSQMRKGYEQVKNEQILFFLENDPKGGPLDDFSVDETLQFCSFFTCL